MRTTGEVFEDHLAKRKEGDVDGDIDTNYADDVVLLTGTGIYKGHDGVRQSASELSHYLGDGSFNYDLKLVEGEYAFLEWSASGQNGNVRDGADGFVVRDGKIVMQNIHYTVE